MRGVEETQDTRRWEERDTGVYDPAQIRAEYRKLLYPDGEPTPPTPGAPSTAAHEDAVLRDALARLREIAHGPKGGRADYFGMLSSEHALALWRCLRVNELAGCVQQRQRATTPEVR